MGPQNIPPFFGAAEWHRLNNEWSRKQTEPTIEAPKKDVGFCYVCSGGRKFEISRAGCIVCVHCWNTYVMECP